MRATPTRAEAAAWELLRNRRCLGLKFRRQYPVRGFIVDFYCPALRLAIELDGRSHEGVEAMAGDAERSASLATEHVEVIRIRNADVSAAELAEKCRPFLASRRWA